MNTPARPRWDQRRFVSLGTLFSALALPATGLGDHLARHSSGPQAGPGWVVAHVMIGALFVFFATWHGVLNRRAIRRFLRGRVHPSALPSREALAALALVGVALVVALT